LSVFWMDIETPSGFSPPGHSDRREESNLRFSLLSFRPQGGICFLKAVGNEGGRSLGQGTCRQTQARTPPALQAIIAEGDGGADVT
jgi:hypothetical protein